MNTVLALRSLLAQTKTRGQKLSITIVIYKIHKDVLCNKLNLFPDNITLNETLRYCDYKATYHLTFPLNLIYTIKSATNLINIILS